MRNKSLKGYFTAQFFGAFNDNAWKMLVVFLATSQVSAASQEYELAFQSQMTYATIALTLPFIFVSLPASFLADWINKRTLICSMKLVEILLMSLATIVLWRNPQEGSALLIILALMGTQSALLSPAKYGILPEMVGKKNLGPANGLLETWTVLAIILGIAAGGILYDSFLEHIWITGLFLVSFSVVGFLSSLKIPSVVPARENGGWQVTKEAYQAIRKDQILLLTILGLTFFWSIATLLQQDVVTYIKTYLNESATKASATLALCGLGIACGSLVSGKISTNHIEMGLIPMGAIGMAGLSALIGFYTPHYFMTTVLMFALGFCAGFVLVPLHALLQWQAPSQIRGAVISLGNILVFTGILFGSLTTKWLADLGASTQTILIIAAFGTTLGTLWALKLLPEALIRIVLILITRVLYRIKIFGKDNIPAEGGALLVSNHVSFVDWLFLIACTDRKIRFVIDSAYYYHPFLKPFLKASKAIPVSSSGGPREILSALRQAGKFLDRGEVVCIFAEGQISRTGMMQPFQRGLEKIVKGRSAPIIPVYLDDVWGSIFSFEGERFLSKLPKRIPYRISVSFGEPLSSETKLADIRKAVHDLSAVSKISQKDFMEPLHYQWIKACRQHPLDVYLVDSNFGSIRRLTCLALSIALSIKLKSHWKQDHLVGILLPPSAGGVLANIAASLSGRASVNLNFTAGQRAFQSAIDQSNISTVLSHRDFFSKINVDLPQDITQIWIEDIFKKITFSEKLMAFALALLAPKKSIERACGAGRPIKSSDLATVIFSSGSTGEPKGVQLTHANIASNASAIAQVIRGNRRDKLLGVLPLFHSFGYMTMWYTANHQLGLVTHPNPLDAATIGELIQHHKVSIMLATPTFLQLYLKRCSPAQLGSLKLVLTGAEKLSEQLAESFENQFGIRPLEGYGATECSPAIALSALDYRGAGFFQPGSRRGSVGQILPGVATQIVDPDTFKKLPPTTPGLLLVKGANVMSGYLGREDLTRDALREGWYVTGDIASHDDDGFLYIQDRLARFSKISGEMVPHGLIEESLHQAAELTESTFAVTGIPDASKGEKIIVLHTYDEEKIPELIEKLKTQGLPNLFIPKLHQFHKIDVIPILGSGKLNLRELKKKAIAYSSI